ncbi:MAG TPA: hypothetical protein VH440_01640 [Candidatus Limnocylindrales bacterium]
MGSRVRGRARWVALAGVTVATMAVLVAVGVGRPTNPPAPTLAPGATEPPPAGPIVFYEIIDADGAVLLERRLDGRDVPHRIASRADVDFGRTWSVDPTGAVALAAVASTTGRRLEAVATADGTDLWTLDVPAIQLDDAVWSPDGRRIALIRRPDDVGPTEAFVIDTRDGHLVRTIVPEDALIQGFDTDNALVLRERVEPPQAAVVAWRFLRIDPASNVVEQLTTPPDVGPASATSEDVDPRQGVGVITTVGPKDNGTAVQLWPLAGGPSRILGVFESVDDLRIAPDGSGVLVAANREVRRIAWDGRAADLWSGDDTISGAIWADSADFVGLTIDRGDPNDPGLTVLETGTGRSVELPISEPVAQAVLLRVIGGTPLPPTALPAIEPGPTPTPAPGGADVAGAVPLASGWFDVTSGRIELHVDRLLPTTDGGMRISASIQPVDLGPAPIPDDGERQVALLPRPGSKDVLIWAETGDRSAGWLWDGAGPVRPVDLPGDWPASTTGVAWRPDGRALAALATRAGLDGDLQGVIAVGVLGSARTTVVPLPRDYEFLQGWWSATELRMGHSVCTEGCEGRYSESARLRIRDGRLTQLKVADRARAPIDAVEPDGNGGLVMSAIHDDPADDVRIEWPSADGVDPSESPEILGFATDGRSLLLAEHSPSGTDVYRVEDPAGDAARGRVTAPRRSLLGHFDRRGLEVDVSPDERWVTTTDRVGTVLLVELATGRTWPIDRDRTLAWWPPH